MKPKNRVFETAGINGGWALWALGAVLPLLVGCREDAGRVDYSALGPVFDRVRADAAPPLGGPKPYQKGEARLSLGAFYEGGYSDNVPVDGVSSNLYIWLAGGQLSLEQQEEELDRVEGNKCDRLTLTGTAWWGVGVVWVPSRDLSEWTTLAVSLKSSTLGAVNITLGSSTKEVGVPAADHGYAADGQWHSLRIPLQKFADSGVDLSAIKVAFSVGASGGSAGQEILVDDVYLE